MGKVRRTRTLGSAIGVLAFTLIAQADHAERPHTPNIHALGHSPHTNPDPDASTRNSDVAFWGDTVIHGSFDGFRIIRNAPGGPKELSWTPCNGDQGDVVVWDTILLRAWNSPANADDPATPESETQFCDGAPVPAGFEGIHIFDISDLEDPRLVGEVELSAVVARADMPGCGSHTLTLVPDLEDDRVLVYNHTSGGNAQLPPGLQECDWLDVIQVPLDNPGAASALHREPLVGGHAAHDSGAILGSVNMLAVASGHMSHVFDIGDNEWPGGSPEDPVLLYTIAEEGVCSQPGSDLCNGNWHTAGFTWDGKVIVLSWEPGGGVLPECEATDPAVKKSMFFYDAKTGAKLGQWTLPRPQSSAENCSIHYYNMIPLRNGRYVVVSGNYQAGTWVTDFTDPANPVTIAWSDPVPPEQLTERSAHGEPSDEFGGVWSSYWYNGFIFESEITKGLNVFRLSDMAVAAAVPLDHLNPQTQEFSLHFAADKQASDSVCDGQLGWSR